LAIFWEDSKCVPWGTNREEETEMLEELLKNAWGLLFFVTLVRRKIKGDQCHRSYCKGMLVLIGIILCDACDKTNQTFPYFIVDLMNSVIRTNQMHIYGTHYFFANGHIFIPLLLSDRYKSWMQ
jgi:hypothetical protein